MTVKKGVIDSKALASDIRQGLKSFKEDIIKDKPSSKEKKLILKKLDAIEELALKIKKELNNK